MSVQPELALRSLAFVESSIAALPDVLAEAMNAPLPPPLPRPARVVTSGIGGSEGPARLLAHRLTAIGLSARFVPFSSRAFGTLEADLLIAFSQGLSPNALLAFPRSHRFTTRWLVTSVDPQGTTAGARRLQDLMREQVVPIVIPPRIEQGTLVRFVGPTVATYMALRLAGALGDRGCDDATLAQASARYQAAAQPLAQPYARPGQLALITAGVTVEEVYGARWKVLETLLVPDPPLWDALSFAHGPLQATDATDLVVLVLETPSARDLVELLLSSLHPKRHHAVRLTATADDALAPLEHAARIDAWLLARLRREPRDLFTWPLQGRECPLYGLGGEGT